jgi:hypothetical protein
MPVFPLLHSTTNNGRKRKAPMSARQCLLGKDRIRPYMPWRINIRFDADIVQRFDRVILRAVSSAIGAAG